MVARQWGDCYRVLCSRHPLLSFRRSALFQCSGSFLVPLFSVIPPGVRFMLASALAFSIMTAFVKMAGERIPSQEIVLFRAIISLGLSWAFLRHAGIPLLGTNRRLLLLRGFLGFLGLSCVYYAVTHLPLAEATVIQYLHPMFTAVMAAIFLREHLSRSVFLAIGVSLVGLVIIARPSFLFAQAQTLDPLALLAALGGAFFSGAAYVLVRKLSSTEHALVIVFYFPLVTIPLALPGAIVHWVWPEGWEWLMLLGVGVFTQLGQVYLTHGLRHEPAGRATALSYSQILFAALWGIFFFGEVPDVWLWVGGLFIVLGTWINIRFR